MIGNNPKTLQPLLELIRPKYYAKGLEVSHKRGDIIPYSISTIFGVYGFQGKPHVLPYQVPLKVGIAKFLWKIGGLKEKS